MTTDQRLDFSSRNQRPSRISLIDVEDDTANDDRQQQRRQQRGRVSDDVKGEGRRRNESAPNVISENDLEEPSTIDETRSLEQVFILLLLLFIGKRIERFVLVVLIDLNQLVDNPVVIPSEQTKSESVLVSLGA